jgi:hypothetical protein
MGNLWAGLFEDIPELREGGTGLDLREHEHGDEQHRHRCVKHVGAMERGSQQLGEQIAFALGLSDEVLTIPEPTLQAMQEFTGFKPPETSAATTSVMENIDAQLAAARAEREAARNAPKPAGEGGGFAPVEFGGGALGTPAAAAGGSTGSGTTGATRRSLADVSAAAGSTGTEETRRNDEAAD